MFCDFYAYSNCYDTLYAAFVRKDIWDGLVERFTGSLLKINFAPSWQRVPVGSYVIRLKAKPFKKEKGLQYRPAQVLSNMMHNMANFDWEFLPKKKSRKVAEPDAVFIKESVIYMSRADLKIVDGLMVFWSKYIGMPIHSKCPFNTCNYWTLHVSGKDLTADACVFWTESKARKIGARLTWFRMAARYESNIRSGLHRFDGLIAKFSESPMQTLKEHPIAWNLVHLTKYFNGIISGKGPIQIKIDKGPIRIDIDKAVGPRRKIHLDPGLDHGRLDVFGMVDLLVVWAGRAYFTIPKHVTQDEREHSYGVLACKHLNKLYDSKRCIKKMNLALALSAYASTINFHRLIKLAQRMGFKHRKSGICICYKKEAIESAFKRLNEDRWCQFGSILFRKFVQASKIFLFRVSHIKRTASDLAMCRMRSFFKRATERARQARKREDREIARRTLKNEIRAEKRASVRKMAEEERQRREAAQAAWKPSAPGPSGPQRRAQFEGGAPSHSEACIRDAQKQIRLEAIHMKNQDKQRERMLRMQQEAEKQRAVQIAFEMMHYD